MSFRDDLDTGELGEGLVKKFLESKGYVVKKLGQSKGDFTAPDLVIESHVNGGDKPLVGKTLEVKTDRLAHETCNVCLEVFSNVGTGRLGWVYQDYGGYLAYLCLGNGDLFIAKSDAIKARLEDSWHRIKPTKTDVNKHFTAINILVPVDEFRKICFWVGSIPVLEGQSHLPSGRTK